MSCLHSFNITHLLLHLLKVGVLDIVGFVAAGLLAACLLTTVELVSARLSGSTALLVHLL